MNRPEEQFWVHWKTDLRAYWNEQAARIPAPGPTATAQVGRPRKIRFLPWVLTAAAGAAFVWTALSTFLPPASPIEGSTVYDQVFLSASGGVPHYQKTDQTPNTVSAVLSTIDRSLARWDTSFEE